MYPPVAAPTAVTKEAAYFMEGVSARTATITPTMIMTKPIPMAIWAMR